MSAGSCGSVGGYNWEGLFFQRRMLQCIVAFPTQLCLIRNSLVKEKVKSTGDSKLVGIFELGSELKNRTKKLLQVGLSKFMKLIKI